MSKAISGVVRRASVILLAAVLLAHCGPSGQPTPSAATPPAAPTKPARLGGPEVEKRVDAILAKMTLEEKIDYIGGVDSFYVREIPRLNVPRLKMADGPFGVRASGFSTTVPAGINLAASWDPAVGERVGTEIGRDARARGVHFLLAPGVNIYRAPVNGRNFEYLGEDPFLASRMVVGYIRGVQSQGVSATVKHFLGNNSEFDRHNTNSIVDERALREIYLPAFEAAVKDGQVGALMTSYNLVDGIHMSQYGRFNTDLLRTEWGFTGVAMSDWSGIHDTAAVNGGQDLEMPSPIYMNRETLLPMIKAGTLTVATIDEKVRRILRVTAEFGWLDRDQTDRTVPLLNSGGQAAALEASKAGMVLLKNDGAVLPFDRKTVRSIAVIGPIAHPASPVGGGAARSEPFSAVSALEGLQRVAGDGVKVYYHRGIPTLNDLADRTRFTTDAAGTKPGVNFEAFMTRTVSGPTTMSRVERTINYVGSFIPGSPLVARFQDSSARWAGYYTAPKAGPYTLFLHVLRGEGGHRVLVDDKVVIDGWELSKAILSRTNVTLSAGPHRIVVEAYRRRESSLTGARVRLGIVDEDQVVEADAREIARHADAVVAAVGFDYEVEAEAADRAFELPVGQEALIRALADVNKKTVVAVTSGGGVDMLSWLDRVPAVVMTWFPGEQGGAALAQLLMGDANFSGHLPITIEKTWADNPSHDAYYPAKGTTTVNYSDGIFVGYRGYEQNKATPLFPFGHGLSYTTFSFSKPIVTPKTGGASTAYTVSFDVANAGNRSGAVVAQVYVAPVQAKVPRPPKELKAFAKIELKPGETRQVSVDLDARSFSYWDSASHQWRADPGSYEILVGESSANTPLKTTLTLK
jgi:beta-glucosidase